MSVTDDTKPTAIACRQATDDHTAGLLDLGLVLDRLADRCLSAAGARACAQIHAAKDGAEIAALLDRVGEYRVVLAEGEEPQSLVFPDFGDSLDRLEVEGAQLEGSELYAIGLFLRSFETIREWFSSRETAPLLREDLSGVLPPTDTGERILGLIDESGSVREEKVPELRRIRDRIRDIQATIGRKIRAWFNDSSLDQVFSSDAPAYRDGRTVLPVKSDFKGRIRGIVHDVSGTGQTVFMEPLDVVDANNERAEREAEYRNVILRILRELSSAVRDKRSEIAECETALAALDTVRARARYSLDFDCERPAIGTRIRLRQARHPLISRREVVPVDIVMDEPTRCLIITGPNTGGKTVALKTAGLISLMFQMGMEVPVGTGSELPVFDEVLADIGDEQSLEQNLSTFSGHMRNISRMIDRAGPRSLLLLDELGSGTDPHEGGALAMAILDRITETQSYALVTTHHGALKRYGYTHESVSNASMEFDDSSLAPTYRLLVGVPGSSHAISIAERSGVPSEILDIARGYLTDGTSDTAEVLKALETAQAELERDRAELERERADMRRREHDFGLQREKVERQRRELREGKLRELDRFAAKARSRLENLVRELREGELTRDKRKEVKQFISELDDELDRARSGATEETVSQAPTSESGRDSGAVKHRAENRSSRPREETIPELDEGVRVRLKDFGTKGVVERAAKKGKWVVATGSVRMTMDESELEVLPEAESRSTAESRVRTETTTSRPVFELDIRGERLAAALDRVERQIDACLSEGLESFTILHGKGTGALQKGVHDLLSGREEIASTEFARPEDGGTGKTVVRLRL
ncbi:MAG: endonuclease MutS2 [Spirochaetales bacterium]